MICKIRWIIPLILFCAQQAVAALETDFFLENYLLAGLQHARESDLNPDNRILSTPSRQIEADLRADFTARWSENQFLKIRPRWILPQQWTEYKNPNETKQSGQGKIDLTDAYWDARWNGIFSTTTGLQVYQWGPAELGNFSNPLFHFNFNQRSIFYKEKGKALVRLNGQWSESFGQVLIVEPVSNREPLWQENQDFQPQALLKSEYQWNSRDNLGIVIGKDDESDFYFGEYGTLSLNDMWSVYIDARHPQGARPFAPRTDDLGFKVLERQEQHDRFDTIGILGTRIESEKFDLRFEMFHNSLGWSADQWRSVWDSVTTLSPWLFDNAKRLSRPGLEIPSRDAFYASIRVPDLGAKRDVTAFLRILESLQDHSRFWQSSIEKSLSDSWTGYLEITLPTGKNNQEYSFSSLGQVFVGAKYVWAPVGVK